MIAFAARQTYKDLVWVLTPLAAVSFTAVFHGQPALAAVHKAKPHAAAPRSLPPLPVKVTVPTPAASTDATAITTETVIYDGANAGQAEVSVSPWGGGSGIESKELYLQNDQSIKIDTKSLYEGAKISLSKPLPIPSLTDGKNHMLVFTIRFKDPDSSAALPASSGSNSHLAEAILAPLGSQPGSLFQTGVYTGNAQLQLAQRGRRGRGGRGGGSGYPGAGYAPRIRYVPVDDAFPVNNIRFAFTLSDGSSVDVLRRIPPPQEMASGSKESWVDVGIPFKIMGLTGASVNSTITDITIGGDDTATMYVGSIRVVDDETPITAFAGDSVDAPKQDDINLHGTGTGGYSQLKYSWSLDEANASKPDIYGGDITVHYDTANVTHKVTLTVSDADGIKAPATSTTTIKVEE